MRTILSLGLAGLLLPATASAQTPEALALDYYERFEAQDWGSIAEFYHEDALSDLREMLQPLFASIEDPRALAQLFGPGVDAGTIQLMNDEEFFTLVFGGLISRMLQQVELGAFEVVGRVEEGEDLLHLVTRQTAVTQGIEITSVEVITMRRSDEGDFKLALSGEIRGMAELLRTRMGQRSGG